MLPEFQILILAMAPLSELNGSIPVGFALFNLPLWKVFLFSFIGNLIPVVIILFFLKKITNSLSSRFKIFESFFNWLFQKTRKKIRPEIIKYGKIGLVSFIALPVPFTGGWTGAIAAFLIGLSFKVALPLIALGVLVNGIIVSVLSLFGIAIEKYFGWQTLLIIIGIITITYLYSCGRKKFVHPPRPSKSKSTSVEDGRSSRTTMEDR